MQLNGETNEQDLYHVALDLCDADETAYPIAKALPYANVGYHLFFLHLHRNSDDWDIQDTNDTTLTTATANLVSGQSKYTILDNIVAVDALEYANASGDFFLLNPIDKTDLVATRNTITDFQKTAGLPAFYDKRGRVIELYPAPNYSYTAGLKLHFKGSANVFTVTDTTKEPGFDQEFHHIIAVEMAIPYCSKYKPERLQMLFAKKKELYDSAAKKVSSKSKDKRRVLSGVTVSAV